MDAVVKEQIEQLRGPDQESARFNLIGAPDSIIPSLEEAYTSESDRSVRADIVHVIWQHRVASCLDFLREALQDPSDEVRKEALDGLVALASPRAAHIVEEEIAKITRETGQRKSDWVDWLKEALDQIQESIRR